MRSLIRPIRSALSKRPLCFACGLFLVVLFLLLYFEWHYTLIAGMLSLALTVGILLLFWLCRRPDRFVLALMLGIQAALTLAFFTAHFSLEYGYHRSIDSLTERTGQAVIVVSRQTDVSVYSTVCEGRLVSLDGEEIGLNGIFYLPYETHLSTGERIAADITLTPIREKPSALSDCYQLSQGLYFKADVTSDSHTLLGHEFIFPYSISGTIKDALSGILMRYLSSDASSLAKALLLGDKTDLPSELSNAFENLGISHALSVSGLHLGILLGSLSWLLKKLHLARKWHLPILLPITLLYIMTVGSASVMRAGGMFLFLLFAYPFGRKRDPLTSLFASVTLICLLSPFSVLDIGLLLSFFSTFGILLVGLPLCQACKPLPSLLRSTVESLILTASATSFTIPFSIGYFGEISLISPLANLLFVPLITALLYLIPILLLSSPFPLLAATPAYLLRVLFRFISFISNTIGGKDTFMLSLDYPIIETLGIVWIVLSAGLLCLRKTRPFVLAGTVVFLSTAGIWVLHHTQSVADCHSVYAYSDGENDALLLRDGTRVMLCDHSNGSYPFLSDAIALAEEDSAIQVDALLITHYHSRLLTTLTHLLSEGKLEYLILPRPDNQYSDLAATLEARALSADCTVHFYSTEECLIGYHRYELTIDCDEEGSHPLNQISVAYDNEEVLTYLADGESESLCLPACHESPSAPDLSYWNRSYP